MISGVAQGRGPQRPFERVAADLRARIGADEWAPGAALPATADLAGQYGVSPSTVTRALRQLADEGLVVTVPRWGVFRAELLGAAAPT